MTNDDHMYLVTDLSEEEILKLFMAGTEPFPQIETFSTEKRFLKWCKTDFYSLDVEKVPSGYAHFHFEDFGIHVNMECEIRYVDGNRGKGMREIFMKTAQFINQFAGDIAFSHDGGLVVLKRADGKLKLTKADWTPELLALIKEDYELVDTPNVE